MTSASTPAPIPVLLYHAVTDDPPSDQPGFTVSPVAFSEHVRAMSDSGLTPVTISELAAGLRGESPLPERPFAVTFDDGFADTPAAVRLLADDGIPSTLYVTSSRLGAEISDDTLDELLAVDGLELGAHTVTHPHLDEIPLRAATREIVESRRELAARTGREVRSFAYPHGAHDQRVRRAVIEAGYSSAAAVKNAISHRRDDPMAIARWTVRSTTGVDEVVAILEGRGAPPAWAGERIRTRAYRSARRLRRRLTAGAA